MGRSKGLDLWRKKNQLKEELRQTDENFRNWVEEASDAEIEQNLKAAKKQERENFENVLLKTDFDRFIVMSFKLQSEEIKETEERKEKEYRNRRKK